MVIGVAFRAHLVFIAIQNRSGAVVSPEKTGNFVLFTLIHSEKLDRFETMLLLSVFLARSSDASREM